MATSAHLVQGELFVLLPEGGSYIPVTETGGPSVDIVVRDVSLLEVLSCLATVSQLDGMSKAMDYPSTLQPIKERYGPNTDQVAAGAQQNRHGAFVSAKWHFARATGLVALIDDHPDGISDDQDALRRDAVRQATRQEFDDFIGLFGGVQGAKRRNEMRRAIQARLRGVADQVSQANRRSGVRPHQHLIESSSPDKSTIITAEPQGSPPTEEETHAIPAEHITKPKLTAQERLQATNERLQAVLQDPRAGFMPTCRQETTMALTFLDYMDNPAYPLQISSQLLEVFRHRQKQERKRLALLAGDPDAYTDSQRRSHQSSVLQTGQYELSAAARAVESIAYEIIDFAHDARRQHAALVQLQQSLADIPNPSIVVGQEIEGGMHPGLLPLFRYREALSYYNGAPHTERFFVDPFVTKSYRWASGDDPGKHKVVSDRYTVFKDPQDQAEINRAAASICVGDARALIGDAVAGQSARFVFWRQRVAGILRLPDAPRFDPPKQSALLTLESYGLKYDPYAHS